VFEVSDVTIQDEREERRAKNLRRLGAVYCDKKGGFEVVHGLLDRIMQVLDVPFIGASKMSEAKHGYYIKEAEGELVQSCSYAHDQALIPRASHTDSTYFPGRAAIIHYRPKPATHSQSDVLHPPATSSVPTSVKIDKSSPLHTITEAFKSALPSASASVSGNDFEIGSLGILHPSVLEKFNIVNPCSALEINVEAFL
jgi:phenylalanyl-tRNA synthetase beta chain